MSMWTAASDELTKFLAQKHIEDRQAMLDELTRQSKEAEISQGNERLQLERENQRRLEQQAKAALDAQNEQRRFQRASAVAQNLPKGRASAEQRDLLHEFGLDTGIIDDTKGAVLPIMTPGGMPAGMAPLPELLSRGGWNVQARDEAAADRAAQLRQQQEAIAEREKQRSDDIAARQREHDQSQANLRTMLAGIAASARANQGPSLNQVRQVKNDYNRLTAPMRTISQQYGVMQAALDRYDKDPVGGAQGVLMTFQKILDPNSVVRESEYARSEAMGGYLNRLFGTVSQAIDGGTTLSPAQMKEIVTTAAAMKKSIETSYAGDRRLTERLADKYHIDRDLIFADDGAAPGTMPVTAPPTTPQAGTAPQQTPGSTAPLSVSGVRVKGAK